MKFKTVREGQQAVVLSHMGEGELVVGPKRVFLFRKRFQLLRSYSATSNQYLVVQENDGTVYHKTGPCSLFHNPLVYDQVKVKDATLLDANHIIVVYKRLPSGDVQRRLVEGPAVFVPEASEWLHEFVWHGTDPENKTRMVPGLRKFTQITVIPDHFYYNVREVRTNDDTMITVKVMVFYVITDILKMLDMTHDPIADIINNTGVGGHTKENPHSPWFSKDIFLHPCLVYSALCADVIAFTSKLSYSQFVGETAQLSAMTTYPQLQQRTANIGLRVDNVVYRGYHATEQMQAMQNCAIESRTRLRLDAEMEAMQQKLTSLRLNSEEARAGLRGQMVQGKQLHEQQLACLRQDHDLGQGQRRHEQTLELGAKDTAVAMEQEKEEHAQQLSFLTRLSALGVSVTDYLVNQQEQSATRQICLTPTARATPHLPSRGLKTDL